MKIELFNPKRDSIKKYVWVHQLFEQEFDINGRLLNVKLVKGYTTEITKHKKKEKRKLEIKFDDEVEER